MNIYIFQHIECHGGRELNRNSLGAMRDHVESQIIWKIANRINTRLDRILRSFLIGGMKSSPSSEWWVFRKFMNWSNMYDVVLNNWSRTVISIIEGKILV